MFCKYKNILGEPKKGIHSYRLFGIAIIDVLLTILLAYIIYFFNKNINFFIILGLVFLLGIILHRLFCVKTTINNIEHS